MRIMVVDDEANQRELLSGFLSKRGHEVRKAESGAQALEMLQKRGAEVVLTDMRMPEMDGLVLLRRIKESFPDTEIVVITAFATVENAVEAMKAGAADYLIKPVNLEHLCLTLQKIETNQRLITENRRLQESLKAAVDFPELIGQSAAFKQVLANIAMVAQSDSTVLITGESGTGKELVAKAIHFTSPRKEGPFIAINCAALPETLLESELFGYERGAFTGAHKRRLGRFELAHKGTLFIDEIGDLSPAVQVKLLRVIENRSFERLGGTESITVDSRLITATNRDLQAKVKDGTFREDLYYRLNVIPIKLPPLRDRREDIMLLAEHFREKFAVRAGKKICGFTAEAKDILLRYHWPGNVRELENAIERAVILSRSNVIDRAALSNLLPTELPSSASGDLLNLAELEKQAIKRALEKAQGRMSEAAVLLGIHRNTLRLKMRQYGLSEPK